MALALYRKYRSKTLAELVGQDHVTTTLANALKSGQISHAYLLTGPKGTGKTSIARILAHQINDLPYEDDDAHLDIIEIDAASNRGIEEIRDLRDKVRLAPSSAKYKVYIIDEVHMLTTHAFNALLKTLEEPPSHVIFILATTELHKLPETIISRTQRYSFRPISLDAMIPHLAMIAKKESITIEDDALRLIAEHANGGFRDAVSLLDQARSMAEKITSSTIEDMIGLPPKERVSSLIDSVVALDGRSALEQLSQLYDDGYQPGTVAKQIITDARQRLMDGTSERQQLIRLLEAVLESQRSANPSVALELSLLVAAEPPLSALPVITQSQQPATAAATPPKSTEKPVVSETKKESKTPENSEKKETVEPLETQEAPEKLTKKAAASEHTSAAWHDTLEAMKGSSNSLYGILRMAEATMTDDSLTLRFQFPFHMKRAAEPKHDQILAETLKKTTGKNYAITYEKLTIKKEKEKEAPKSTPKAAKPAETDDGIRNVLSVFGGGEIVN